MTHAPHPLKKKPGISLYQNTCERVGKDIQYLKHINDYNRSESKYAYEI